MRMYSMSLVVMFTSSAVMYLPLRFFTKRPNLRSSASVFSVLASPMMTALPPPRFRPEMAAL